MLNISELSDSNIHTHKLTAWLCLVTLLPPLPTSEAAGLTALDLRPDLRHPRHSRAAVGWGTDSGGSINLAGNLW